MANTNTPLKDLEANKPLAELIQENASDLLSDSEVDTSSFVGYEIRYFDPVTQSLQWGNILDVLNDAENVPQ